MSRKLVSSRISPADMYPSIFAPKVEAKPEPFIFLPVYEEPHNWYVNRWGREIRKGETRWCIPHLEPNTLEEAKHKRQLSQAQVILEDEVGAITALLPLLEAMAKEKEVV